EWTWAEHMAALGAPVALTMPQPGFYPRGGGTIEATVAPAKLRPARWVDRGPLLRIRGRAGVARLRPDIAERMRRRAEARFVSAELDVDVEIDEVEWTALSPGAAIALVAEYDGLPPATFVGLGERGKPSEAVADEAVDALLAHAQAPGGAVDPHSADQILLPLALAEGPSEYTVSEVTEHLRTNVRTVREFIDREITLEESHDDGTGRVVIA
ncbi:MAG: RNA 3'-terminal phosphate cyclase, partial [Isosphaeraceae bacterium]